MELYECDFQNARPHGKGKVTLPDGRIYEGDFQNGMRRGKGKETQLNGTIYEGDFKMACGMEREK